MISLSFKGSYRSILDLPSVGLPDFTILTGVNGSGKSHLLEAILNGNIFVEGIAIAPGAMTQRLPKSDIRRYTWSSLVLNDSMTADPNQLMRDREAVIKEIANGLTSLRAQFKSAATGFNREFSKLTDDQLVNLNPADFTTSTNGSAGMPVWWDNFALSRKQFETKANTYVLNQGSKAAALLKWVQEKRKSVLSLVTEDLEEGLPLSANDSDLFEQDLSRAFAAYHKAFENNRYRAYRAESKGEPIKFLTDEQFIERFGSPPWELFNKILQEADLDYTINSPSGSGETPFEAKLFSKKIQREVAFRDLSSGEQVIMSLALCLYHTRDKASAVKIPKLLLLDEIDAPLHPSMARLLVKVLHETIVKSAGIKVILTTHSPATVALSPEGSLFHLERSPRSIISISRESAIQALTSGYISVTDNTRFVITEAKRDRLFYAALFKALVDQNIVDPSPNLVFVQASDTKDVTGGGRAQVQQWGTKLAEAGLSQIMGLVDRDNDNTATEKIKVLGRYSVENYLLDPLILFAVAMNLGVHEKIMDVDIPNQNFFKLLSLEQTKLQSVVDTVCALLENHESQLKRFAGCFEIEYVGDRKVIAPLWLKDFRGHDLTRVVREAFRAKVDPGFIITQDDCKNIEEMMCLRLPQFIPTEFVNLFKALQSA